ncbi:MAG: hypothetical protein AB2551_13580 [Candidatus Thiodiazotropha sp.]
MKPIAKADSLLGIAGLVTSIVLYLRGKTNPDWIDYAVTLAPTLLAVVIIIGLHLAIYYKKKIEGLLVVKKLYNRIISVRTNSTLVARVLNNKGDVRYERTYSMTVVSKESSIDRTKRDYLFSGVSLDSFPPEVTIVESPSSDLKLIPRVIDERDEKIDGRHHYKYGWYYDIDPPLSKSGQILKFGYSLTIPECEANAFTEDGALFFMMSDAAYTKTECTLISPENYIIEILDQFIEEPDATKVTVDEGEGPVLSDNAQVLTWRIGYRPSAKFVVKYRLKKSPTSPNNPMQPA